MGADSTLLEFLQIPICKLGHKPQGGFIMYLNMVSPCTSNPPTHSPTAELEDLTKLGECLQGIYCLYKECLEGIKGVKECLEGVTRVSGSYLESVWMLSE